MDVLGVVGAGLAGVVAKLVTTFGPMVDESGIRVRWLLVRDELYERGRRTGRQRRRVSMVVAVSRRCSGRRRSPSRRCVTGWSAFARASVRRLAGLIGNYKNGGGELAAAGTPILVSTHDFIDKQLGNAIPYGIYDVGPDEGWVSDGVDADAAQFAVAAIRSWWEHLGRGRYPGAMISTITADWGGSDGYRTRVWKTEPQPPARSMITGKGSRLNC